MTLMITPFPCPFLVKPHPCLFILLKTEKGYGNGVNDYVYPNQNLFNFAVSSNQNLFNVLSNSFRAVL